MARNADTASRQAPTAEHVDDSCAIGIFYVVGIHDYGVEFDLLMFRYEKNAGIMCSVGVKNEESEVVYLRDIIVQTVDTCRKNPFNDKLSARVLGGSGLNALDLRDAEELFTLQVRVADWKAMRSGLVPSRRAAHKT